MNIEAIKFIFENPLTVVLLVLGVICVIVAINGETLRGNRPLSKAKIASFFSFGAFLIILALCVGITLYNNASSALTKVGANSTATTNALTRVEATEQILPTEHPAEITLTDSAEASPVSTRISVVSATVQLLPTPTDSVTPEPLATVFEGANDTWIVCDQGKVAIEDRYFTISGFASCEIILSQGEFIVGTADKFQENIGKPDEGTPCTAFLIRGPTIAQVDFWYGGGDYYTAGSTSSESFIEGLLATKQREVANHQTCSARANGVIDVRRLP